MQATLQLSVRHHQHRSRLQHSYVTPPIKLLTLPDNGSGTLHAVQMSSSPGMLAGDTVHSDITLGEYSRLNLRTQAYNRILSMKPGEYAEQHSHIRLQHGSSLSYLPHPLVLHEGSGMRQTTRIELADHCTLLYGEILAAGRILNGEAYRFHHLSSHLTIHHQDRPLIHDNIQWQPHRHQPQQLGQMDHYSHQLNLFYCNTAASDTALQALNDRLHETLAESFPHILWGSSQAATYTLCLRALGTNGQELQQLLHQAAALLPPP